MSFTFSEQFKQILGLGHAVPSTSTPDYISLKHLNWVTAVIKVTNVTTVTGSAITLKQASDVAATGEKALAFTKAFRNVDRAAAGGHALAEFAVTSNTFTTDATNSKLLIYVIEIDPASLDVANGFDCLRVGTGDATAASVSVEYICHLKYAGAVANQANLIVD